MKKENRYIVIKIKDAEKYLAKIQVEEIKRLAAIINQGRGMHGKLPLDGIFIEKDWPEYYPTETLLAERVDGVTYTLKSMMAQTRSRAAGWSDRTFGANRSPVGPLKHLAKEALEAASAPDDVSEYADCQLLLWDACRNAKITDRELIQACSAKLDILEKRTYPKPKDGEISEHDRSIPDRDPDMDGMATPKGPEPAEVFNKFTSRWERTAPKSLEDAAKLPDSFAALLSDVDQVENGINVTADQALELSNKINKADSSWEAIHNQTFGPSVMGHGVHTPPHPLYADGCDKAPVGWHCTRHKGHTGPCAADVSEAIDERELFESWARRRGWDLTRKGIVYKSRDTDLIWRGWQAKSDTQGYQL